MPVEKARQAKPADHTTRQDDGLETFPENRHDQGNAAYARHDSHSRLWFAVQFTFTLFDKCTRASRLSTGIVAGA